MNQQYERARARGRALLLEHLGIEPDVGALLAALDAQLGTARAWRSIELIRAMRLSQRYHGLSALAALVAGTRELGAGWWSRPRAESVAPLVVDDVIRRSEVSPDEVLAAALPSEQAAWPSTVVELGWWIADDVAVARWGPLVDDIDLNDPHVTDRIRALPPNAEPGHRVTARFDAGGVVNAIVERRGSGALGSRLLDETRYSVPAELDWAWAVALPPPGPFPLPGDAPDVYGSALDTLIADQLRTEALAFGWPLERVGTTWRTRHDLCCALARLDWPWLDGLASSHRWNRAVTRLLDGV